MVGVGPKIGRKAKDKLEEKTENGGQSFKSDKKSRKKYHLASNMTFFSFALLIMFGFHAKHSAFSKCFPKREGNPSSTSPLFTPLPPAPTPWKRCLR